MEKVDTTWRIFGMYMLVILFMLLGSAASGQIKITQFNAEWNKGNEVNWIDSLSDCQTLAYVDISTQKESQKKHKIAVIPTIIIFKDNVEVARFQADLSFKMVATRREVQEEIDNQLMSDF
jgi:hypothetical protein